MKLSDLHIVKRDGSVVSFSLEKIKNAIRKAFVSVGRSVEEEEIDMILLLVVFV